MTQHTLSTHRQKPLTFIPLFLYNNIQIYIQFEQGAAGPGRHTLKETPSTGVKSFFLKLDNSVEDIPCFPCPHQCRLLPVPRQVHGSTPGAGRWQPVVSLRDRPCFGHTGTAQPLVFTLTRLRLWATGWLKATER